MVNFRQVSRTVGIVIAVLAIFLAGYLVRWALTPVQPQGAPSSAAAAGKVGQRWICSMDPQVNLPEPGKCPICGMDLVPLTGGDEQGPQDPRRFTTSETALALMDVETAVVERRIATAAVRMTGKVDYDETRLSYITAWVPGRLDRVFVDYTGVPVRKGDHMVELYSPELLSAQEELLQAVRSSRDTGKGGSDLVRQATLANVDASRGKLRLWGLSAEQIADIEKRGEATDRVTIYAPSGGIVVSKQAQQGMYVKVGSRIYTIADLSHVWVKLDAYESDLPWLRYGQTVEFTTIASPGRTFEGKISFISPVLDRRTHTVKVRVNAPNPEGLLKPDLLVKAVVRAQVDGEGSVLVGGLAGKWICPMHPAVVKDAAGSCDVCGMALETAESLGHVAPDPTSGKLPLLVPATAVLKTGTRAVAYVEVDPSLLTSFRIRNWAGLIARLKPPTTAPAFANTRCPMMGTVIDPGAVPSDLIREYKGKKVAFCCEGCPDAWDALDDADKQAKLAGAKVPPPARRFAALFDASVLELLDPAAEPTAELQIRLLGQINAILRRRDLYDATLWPKATLGEEAQGLLSHGVEKLPPRSLTRLNRLLLEQTFQNEILKARNRPTFEGRVIVLGPRAGDSYIVQSGLSEGDRVVARGSFKIDSALQIQARPSMMSPEGGRPAGGHAHHGGGNAHE